MDEVGQVEQEILRQPLHGLVHTKRQGVEDGDRGHVQRNWQSQPLHGSVRHDHHCSQVSDTSTGFSLIVDKTSAKAFLRPAAASAAPSLERPPNSGARPVTSQNNDMSRKGWELNGFFLIGPLLTALFQRMKTLWQRLEMASCRHHDEQEVDRVGNRKGVNRLLQQNGFEKLQRKSTHE